MRASVSALGIFACLLALVGCSEQPGQKITTKDEVTLKELSSPSADASGHWSADWKDPTAGFTEKFTMDLQQDGNKIEGTAAFVDSRRTKAVVSGQISSNSIHLVMKPDSADLHETSWTGTVSGASITGVWYLHGKPPKGMATTGPWSGSREKK